MTCRRLALVVIATLVLLAPLGVAAAPKNNNAVIESEKKPGKTCGNLARGGDAYKQCIQAQAHIGQKPKKP